MNKDRTKRQQKTKKTRILSVILSVALAISSLQLPALNVSAATTNLTKEEIGNNTYVADSNTMNGWETYFGENSTDFAGAVWSDKSVFTSGTNAFADVTRRGGVVTQDGTIDNNVMLADEEKISADTDNFLVAMSALGATKEIEGYSSLPTDTMLVLDLSQSMDNSNSIPSMIDAANAAIHALLNLNNYNRVGVVLYSGLNRQASSIEETGRVILPLGRYTTATDNEYLTYIEHAKEEYQWQNGQYVKVTWADTSVSLDGDIRHEDGTRVTISAVNDTNSNPMNDWRYKNTEGGTFTQNGLYKAYEEFKARIDANDTTIETGDILGGTKRMPIYVLMSDGAPTTVDSDYNNVEDSDAGSGLLTCDEFGFLTQLTAAWVRGKTEDGYGTDTKFYTLGLNLSSQDADGKAIADSVLDPAKSTNGIKDYWDSFLNSTRIQLEVQRVTNQNTSTSQIPANGWTTVYVDNDGYLKEPTEGETHPMMYVDRAFSATGKDELVSAFENIVSEIILQSKYYPTLVTSGEQSLDGYLTFGDEIGEFMEVKDIKGMVLGNKLFSGASFSQKLTTGAYGNASTYTEYGHELLDSIEERLSIPEQTARTLLSSAWRDGQLAYTSHTQYSNYIGWYADANAGYIGFWDKEDIEINVPQLAKYKVKSYVFQGELGADVGHVSGGDMMHVVVQVYEDIATGDQSVVWKIPAALIPLVTYSVTVDSNSLLTADEITLERETADPLRLVFEVGLRSDINSVNLMDKMSGEGHTHPVTDGDKIVGYAFYTNRWGTGDHSTDVDHLDPNAHLATVSHFHPSAQNERYYYTENAIIHQLVDGKYEQYDGAAKPSGEGFYHIIQIVENTGSGNTAKLVQKQIAISPDVLAATGEFAIQRTNDGVWYVPTGQIMQQLTRFTVEKQNNETGTLAYTDYPVVDRPTEGEDEDDYHIFTFLGNNGRLVMYAEQGIKLSKTIDDPSASGTFEFQIKLDRDVPNGVEVVDIEGNEITHAVNGDTITVSIQNNETIYIVGLSAGTKYEVTESRHDDYKVANVTVNGAAVTGEVAEGTITEYKFDDVAFVNTASSHEGDLEIIKTVTHDYGDEYEIPDKTFEIVVDLEGVTAGTTFTATGTVKGGDEITEVVVDGDGNIVLNMAHEDSVIIKGMPEGTAYTVTEESLPKGFALDTTMSTDLEGTIISDDVVVEHLYNNYNSEDVNGKKVIVQISKNYDSALWENEVFEFVIEQNDAEAGEEPEWKATGIEGTIEKSTSQPIRLNLSEITFAERGTYNFRISEVKGNDGHVVYDETKYYFNVVVTDQDMDGNLEISDVTSVSATVQESADGNITTYTIPVTFTNHHVTDPNAEAQVTIDIYKDIPVNATGVTIDKSEFEFGLYTNEECTTFAKDKDGNDIKVNASMVGEAAITLNYVAGSITFPDNENSVTYTYYLKEIPGSMPGMTYDDTVYTVEVVVSKISEGKIDATATIRQGEISTAATVNAVFNNEYKLAGTSVIIDGKKTLTDKDNAAVAFANGDFEFVLYEADSAFEYNKKDDEIDRVPNAGSDFAFEKIDYSTIGHYYYVVQEVVGTNPAIDYDPATWHVTVVVAPHDTEARLVATVTNNLMGGGIGDEEDIDIQFNNKYKIIENATITIGGDKDLVGKALTAGEFEFGLYSDETCTTLVQPTVVSAATSGRFEFATIEYSEVGTHTYYIKEVIPADASDTDNDGKLNKGNYDYDNTVHKVVITVADKGNGVLQATADVANSNIRFVNDFTPDPVTVRLEATKKFVEDDDTETAKDVPKGTFTFALYPAAPTNSGYVISGPAIAELTNGQQYNIDKIEDFADVAGVGFTLQYTETGVQYYLLKEISGSDHTIKYDTTEYEIQVLVTDYGNGVLVPTMQVDGVASGASKTDLEFKNIHKTVVVDEEIVIQKNVKNNTGESVPIGDFEFEFGMYSDAACKIPINATDGTHIKSVADADGDATIHLQYNDSGMGPSVPTKTFTYYVKEIVPADKLQYMVYDESIYKVDVVLKYVENNELIVEEKITRIQNANGETVEELVEAIEFNNIYNTTFVGDVTITGNKFFENKDITKDQFTFIVKDLQSNTSVEVKNDADGEIVFLDKVTYDAAGSYYYYISEKVPEGAVYNAEDNTYLYDGITYDGTVYRLTIVVEDDGKGKLSVDLQNPTQYIIEEVTLEGDKVVASKDVTKNGANFINEYNIPGLSIEKTQAVNGSKVTNEKLKVKAGDVVTYYIKVANTVKSSVAKELVITDKVPAGLVVDENSISNGGVLKDGVITWKTATLEGGKDITFSFKVTVPDVKEKTTWENVATVIDADSDKPEESNKVVIEEGMPKLVVAKYQRVNLGSATDKKVNAKAGDKVIYSIVVTNEGTEAAEGVTITDKVPAGLTLVENAITEGGKVVNGVVTWTIDEIAVGQSVVVHFAVTVPAVEKDTDYKNIATVVYDNNYEGPDVPQETNEVTFTNEMTAPKTGDTASTMMWSSLAFGSLMVCGVLLIINKKRNEEA